MLEEAFDIRLELGAVLERLAPKGLCALYAWSYCTLGHASLLLVASMRPGAWAIA
jgi:hypothetical protein